MASFNTCLTYNLRQGGDSAAIGGAIGGFGGVIIIVQIVMIMVVICLKTKGIAFKFHFKES